MRRSAVIALLLALPVLPGTAGSSPPAVCEFDPRPRLSREERNLRDTIAARKSWGLPHGRAFVRRVNARPGPRRRGYRLLDFPMTRREAAYFRLRHRFQDPRRTRRLDAYLRRHRETFGGSSIEDDYPRSPYMLVHFTNDLAKHRRAIARRFALRFVVRRVRFTERELRRIQNSIDFDGLEHEGIIVLAASTEPDRVRVEIVSERTDAEEVLRRRYGPALSVETVATTRTFLACSSPATYRVAEDGRTLHVTYLDSGSVDPLHVEVDESATEVRLGIVSEVPYGAINADATTYRLSVTLAEPLGDRVVRSIGTGRRVRLEDSLGHRGSADVRSAFCVAIRPRRRGPPRPRRTRRT